MNFPQIDNVTYTQIDSYLFRSVIRIGGDYWSYGISPGTGNVSLSPHSQLIEKTAVNHKSGFLLDTGAVAPGEQAFAGTYSDVNPELYIGGGNYGDLFPSNGKETIKINTWLNGAFSMNEIAYGKVKMDSITKTPVGGNWYDLYPAFTPDLIFAPNFRGLGLPSTYIYHIITDGWWCEESFCHREEKCEDLDLFSEGYTFKFQFDIGTAQYLLVPLGALAVQPKDGSYGCKLYIQEFEPSEGFSSQVVLGSFVIQLFRNYVDYDPVHNSPRIFFRLSDFVDFNDAYIGSAPTLELDDGVEWMTSEQVLFNV